MSRILIVDDTRTLREAYAFILHAEGYEVECASSGEDGLRQVAARKPDLIVLDMVMPGGDGLSFLERLPFVCTLPLPPVIANSGLDTFAVPARQRGAAGFLLKPVETGELVAAVRGLLAAVAGGLAA